MVRLNSRLRKALAALTPMSGRGSCAEAMADGRLDPMGLTDQELRVCAKELQDAGMLYLKLLGDGDFRFVLTSSGACYFRDSKIEVAKTVGKYLFQLLVGASGGLVVLLVSRALGQ